MLNRKPDELSSESESESSSENEELSAIFDNDNTDNTAIPADRQLININRVHNQYANHQGLFAAPVAGYHPVGRETKPGPITLGWYLRH